MHDFIRNLKLYYTNIQPHAVHLASEKYCIQVN